MARLTRTQEIELNVRSIAVSSDEYFDTPNLSAAKFQEFCWVAIGAAVGAKDSFAAQE